VVLFVRFFVERYQFYGFGPLLVSLIRISESIIRPLKEVLPRGALALRDHIPLAAIGVVLVIRGFVIWILGPGFAYPFLIRGILSPLDAMAVSLTMAVLLFGEMLIAFLFASLMISRRGINMYGNGGFVCFQEKTFAIFNYFKKIIPTHNLTTLFLASSAMILILTALLAGVANLSLRSGLRDYEISVLVALFEVLNMLIYLYSIVLILAILSSWIGADQFSVVVQIVRSMSDPYLDFFRRWFPWARIDFIDLSPIFAFLLLNPLLTRMLILLQAYLLHLIDASTIPGIPVLPPDADGIRI
jgi:YggT family protein